MKNSNRLIPKLLLRGGFVSVAMWVASLAAQPANDTWTGNATPDGSWTNAANWTGGNNPPLPGDFLFFDGSQIFSTNTYASGTVFGQLTFVSTAGGFTLAGNPLTLPARIQDSSGNVTGGGITNLSPAVQTVNLPLTLADGLHYLINGAAGQLNLSGVATRNVDATANFNTVSGVINTAGSGLTNDSSANGGIIGGWAVINAANNVGDWAEVNGSANVMAYTGYTGFNGGTSFGGTQTGKNVKIQTRSSTANSLSGSTAGTYDMNSLIWNIGNANPAGNQTLNVGAGQVLRLGTNGGIMNVHGNSRTFVVGSSASGVITAGGPNNNTPGELTLVQLNANGGQLQIAATLADNGTGPVTVNEEGSVNYNFPNTYSGGTHIHFGEAFLQGGARFGTGPIYIYPGARADFGSQNGATIANNFFIEGYGFVQANQPGTIKGAFNGTFTGAFTLMGNAAIDPNAGGSPNTCTFTGPFTGTGSLSIGSSIGAGGYVEGTAVFGGNLGFTGDAIADATPNNNGGAGIKIASGSNNIVNIGGNVDLIGGSTGIASFDLNGTTQTINGLTTPTGFPANALVKSSAGNGLLNVGNNNASSIFTGNMQNGGGTLALTKIGSGTVALDGANSFTGATTISNGTLAISSSLASAQILVASGALFDVSAAGTFTLGTGQTLGGNGAVNGSISTASGAIISPGFGPGTLTLSNDLTLGAGAVCLMELSATTNGANDQIVVGGNLNLSGATVQISASALQPGRYKLIRYAGVENGTAAGNLVLSYSGNQSVALDDSIPNEIDLLVTSSFITQLSWLGDGTLNAWDINSTADWRNGAAASVFTNGTAVIFNDSGSKTPDVNISAAVQPASMLVSNNSGTYTFSGNGNIAGGTSMIKKGAGALVLNDIGGDSFGGGISVQAGSLVMSNQNVNTSGGLTVASGSAFLANNGAMAGNVVIQSSGSLVLDQTATLTGNLVVSNGGSAQLGDNDGSGTLPSGSVTVNGTLNFNHVDDILVSSDISGTGTLNKNTNDAVTLTGTSGFGGNININSGTLQSPLASGLGSFASGTITVANGATLNKGTDEVKSIVALGFGVSSNGAIINTSGNQIFDGNGGLTPSLTLLGDTMMAGNTRLDIGGINGAVLSTGGNNFNMFMNNSDYMEWEKLTIDTNFGNINLLQGTFGLKGCGEGIGNPTNTIMVSSNAELQFWGDTTNNSGYNKNLHALSGATISFRPQNANVFYTSVLTFEDGSTWNIFNGSGSIGTVFFGPVTLNGLVHIQVGDSTCTVSNIISGPGGFFWDNFNNTLAFAAANTYQGVTDIRAGRTLALVGNGSLLNSSNILLAATANLVASNRVDGTLTLATGQTLSGSGAVVGNLIVGNGATVSPGSPIGTLSVSNGNAALSGTTVIEVDNTAGSNSLLRVAGATGYISYGGTLVITNISAPFTAGQSIQIFSSSTYSNSFTTIVPLTPGAGLAWDTSQLAVNGTIGIASTAPSVPPTIHGITINGGNVILSGTNNVGPGGTYHVLSSTNLTLPLSNWTVLTNGSFDGNGNFSVTNATGASSRQFYILQIP